MVISRFAQFAWLVLGYNLLVIVWGAYVRASGPRWVRQPLAAMQGSGHPNARRHSRRLLK